MGKALEKVTVSEIQKHSTANIAIRILGATLDNQANRLLKILKENESDDAVVFCALSGIFVVVGNSEESLNDTLGMEHYQDSSKELNRLIEMFTEILTKNNYDDYQIAVLPGEKIVKEKFWIDVWGKLFSQSLMIAFGPFYRKDDMFFRANLVNKILFIGSQYNLFDKDLFFQKHIKKVIFNEIDSHYVNRLSNSVSKIWDAGRAAWEYFIRKFILFNPSIPENLKKAVQKRWQAWFLLEDHYKQNQKAVKRVLLKKEMEEILKKL